MYLQKNLKYILELNDLSYREVSKNSGVSIRAISTIINHSNVNVTLNTVIKLTSYFRITLDDLVYKDLKKENAPVTGIFGKEK